MESSSPENTEQPSSRPHPSSESQAIWRRLEAVAETARVAGANKLGPHAETLTQAAELLRLQLWPDSGHCADHPDAPVYIEPSYRGGIMRCRQCRRELGT